MFANLIDVEQRTCAKLPWQADIPKAYRRNAYSIADTVQDAFLPLHERPIIINPGATYNNFLIAVRFSKAALEFILGLKLNFF